MPYMEVGESIGRNSAVVVKFGGNILVVHPHGGNFVAIVRYDGDDRIRAARKLQSALH